MSNKTEEPVKTLKIKVELEESSIDLAWKYSTYNCEVWNWALARRKEEIGNGVFLNYEQQCKEFTTFRLDHREYSEVHSRTFQLTMRQLDSNFKTYWTNRKESPEKNHHLPGFQRRFNFNTFSIVNYIAKENQIIGIGKFNNLIKFKSPVAVPKKIFKVRCGILKLSYDSRTKEFYLHVPYFCERQAKIQVPENKNSGNAKTMAIDLGRKTFGVGIDENKNLLIIPNTVAPVARYFDLKHDELRSKRDKCKKGSRRYRKLTKKMAQLQVLKNRQINYIQAKIAKSLFEAGYKNVVVGDLNTESMARSTNASNLSKVVKKRINRSVHQQWFAKRFGNRCSLTSTRYKEATVDKVNERGSTRTCNNCGFTLLNGVDPSIRVHDCLACSIHVARDVNSCVNIFNHNQMRLAGKVKSVDNHPSNSQRGNCGMNPPMKVTTESGLRRATLKVTYNYVGKSPIYYK